MEEEMIRRGDFSCQLRPWGCMLIPPHKLISRTTNLVRLERVSSPIATPEQEKVGRQPTAGATNIPALFFSPEHAAPVFRFRTKVVVNNITNPLSEVR